MDITWEQLNELYHRAMNLPEAEREPFVRNSLIGCPEQQDELLRMLAVGGQQGPQAPLSGSARYSFLNLRRVGRQTTFASDESAVNDAGRELGDYQVLRVLGEGGMGRVYLARHQVTHQFVAIKVLRQDRTLSQNILQRFDFERQLLAVLDHANIARLLNVGQTDVGRPFFVMEYVDGQPITDYCSTNCLRVRERLRLFQAVLAAVSHAHSFGIVHRDLKPGNILITSTGVPKLVDFGVAKVLSSVMVNKSVTLTIDGATPMTPEYASPEQLNGRPVGITSDVYSLGTVLYEILTGSRPFQFLTRSPLEIAQIVCDEEPVRPSSVRPAAPDSSIGSRSADAVPSSPLATSPTQLRGDLDAIVLKAIRKEPARRYRSVDEFAEDIDRYFQGLPVLARKGTRTYVMGRLLRRHALAVASSAILLLALIGALFGTWRAWERATQVAAEKQLMVNHQTIQLADSAVDSGHPLDAFQRLSPFIAESTAAQPEWELLHIFGRILQATDLTQMRGMRELPNAGDILLRDTRERDWLWFGGRSTTQPTIRGWQLERVLAGAVTPDFVLNVDYNRLSCAAAAVRAGQDRVCYFLPAFGPDTTLVLAELRSGKELDRTQVTALTDFASWPGPVMFSPDGQRLVALHSCGRLTLWSLTQDRLELIGDQDLDEVGGYAVRFSPTGEYIGAYSMSGSLSAFAANDLTPVCRIPFNRFASAFDWCPDGKRLVAADGTGNVMVFGVPGGEKLAEWNEGSGVACLDTADDGQRMVTVCDTSVRVRDLHTGQLLHKFQAAAHSITDAECADQDRTLIVCDREHNVRVWPFPTRVPAETSAEATGLCQSWQASDAPISWLFLHPQGHIVGTSNDQRVDLWDLSTQQQVQSLAVSTGLVFAANFTADGNYVVTRDYSQADGDVARLWNWQTGQQLKQWPDAQDIAVHTRLPYFGIVGKEGPVRVVSTTDWTTTPLDTVMSPHQDHRIEFANTSPRFAVASKQGQIRVYELKGTKARLEYSITDAHSSLPTRLLFSPDDRLLASGGRNDFVVHLWDATSGRKLRTIPSHTGNAKGISFSPSGRRLAIPGDDNRIRLWDPETGAICYETTASPTREQSYSRTRFTPDGQSLIASSNSGLLTVLGSASLAEFQAGKEIISRVMNPPAR